MSPEKTGDFSIFKISARISTVSDGNMSVC